MLLTIVTVEHSDRYILKATVFSYCAMVPSSPLMLYQLVSVRSSSNGKNAASRED